MSHIFISYVREDQELVDKLVSDLKEKGALIWLDRDAIDPGQLWQDAIRDAIEKGNFFIACFSNNSVNKQKSVMNEELIIAVNELRKKQYGTVWFIPVLLNYCTIPRIRIGPDMTLHSLQWVSLADNWEEGIRRIANITLELEKKKFREEIDRKANAVIDAERKLLRQEYLETENLAMKKDYDSGRYVDALSVYRERISIARDNYNNFEQYYTNRFREEYGPITELYTVFRKENPEPTLEGYGLNLIDKDCKRKTRYINAIYFLIGIILTIVYIIDYFFK